MLNQAPTISQLQSLFAVPVCIALREPADYLHELSTEERSLTGTMGAKRLQGFTAGRAAAKEALGKLGVHDSPVLIGEKRKPIWPAGISGSISHCKDLCIAVVTNRSNTIGIGVDVEQLKVLSEGVQKLIMTDSELNYIRTLAKSQKTPKNSSRQETASGTSGACLTGEPQGSRMQRGEIHWPCVVFSIKESLFKCLNPITEKWIDFHQAQVSLEPASGRFSVVLDPSVHTERTGQMRLDGRFVLTQSHVFSAAVLI